MKKVQIAFVLIGMLFADVAIAQQAPPAPAAPAAPAPPARRRPVETQDPNAPATKYDYHDLFAPFFYTKNGNDQRAATGEPGPGYWQNRAD